MLDRLKPRTGARHTKLRKGRGHGSGKGRTCGRGQKGAGARSGHKIRPWFEGGQMPLARRIPKRGFTNPTRVPHQVVNLKDLERFDAGSELDAAALAEAGLVARPDRPVKVLAEGELSKKLTLRVAAASAAATQKIEAAGGSVELVAKRKRGGAAPK